MNFADWKNDLPAGWSVVPLRAVADYEVSNVDKLTDEQEVPVRQLMFIVDDSGMQIGEAWSLL